MTNDELQILHPEINTRWTYETLGIKERRVLEYPMNERGLAIEASIKALEDANINGEELALIIVGTSCNPQVAPAMACFIQQAIKAKCPAFDMTSVCASFIHAICVAQWQLAHSNLFGFSKPILVVGVDDLFSVSPWQSRDIVYFGAGAGAVILDHGSEMKGLNWGTDSSGVEAWQLYRDGEGLFWQMEGSRVYDLAVKWMSESIRLALEQTELTLDDVDHVIPHQPSIQILKGVARKLDIPFSKFHTHMDKYANTGAAAVPLGLDIMNKSGKLKKGDIVVLSAVGAGWSWGTVVMEW
jgi:3-oxoacyl-[acyl-carrier-protein] synthase-3